MPSTVNIVRATLPFLDRLRQIAIKTFTDTYGHLNTPENMRQYIENAFNRDRLAGELQNPLCQYWLAMLDEDIAGYIKINFGEAQTNMGGAQSLELERIYVLPACKGQGIGAALLNKAIGIAREHGLESVWLGVWEQNGQAIRFYEKMGFQKAGEHTFLLGSDEQRDFVMKYYI